MIGCGIKNCYQRVVGAKFVKDGAPLRTGREISQVKLFGAEKIEIMNFASEKILFSMTADMQHRTS